MMTLPRTTKPIKKRPPLEGDLGRSMTRKEIDDLIKTGTLKEPQFKPSSKRLRNWDK
jgi:hypothetical protein